MSYKRKQKEKQKLEKLYKNTKNSYGAGAWYDERKGRYIRYSCHNEWLKTHSRRITRRKMKNETGRYSNCSYKKFYDYWGKLL